MNDQEEQQQENVVIEVNPIDVVQNELVLGIGTPPEANGGGDALEANDDQPENIVRWTLSEKMKQKAYYKGFL